MKNAVLILGLLVAYCTLAGCTGFSSTIANKASNSEQPLPPEPSVPNKTLVAPTRIGLMGEAEISEYFVKQLGMRDANDVLFGIDYIVIGRDMSGNPTAWEHHSFSEDTLRAVRYDYKNLMPSSRDIKSFSQTTATGFMAIGAYLCIDLFNHSIAKPNRRALFGIDDFPNEGVSTAQRDRIIDVLIEKLAEPSAVDIEPIRSDMKKIMQDHYNDALARGVPSRHALEEMCAVLTSSLTIYLL